MLRWIFLLPICTNLFAAGFAPVDEKCSLAIVTPSLAERKTAKIRLENGLEAYLISDPGCHESAASLAVHCGSWDDPVDAHGTAHFVEHMLFMGTEKYPDESEYQRFLDEQGGKHNAFTANDRTVFMFSVKHAALAQALDRFAQFFISPCFNPSCIQRERNAVDQEFSKNIPHDGWRLLHVKKELANPDHPLSRFTIGNAETLGHMTQDDLKKWYESHYSANLMHLVVLSDLPLEKLEEMVVTTFSAIKNKELAPSHFTPPLFTEKLRGHLLTVAAKQQVQKVELSWEIDGSLLNAHEEAPCKLLSHVLGHEGDKTLFSLLKKEGLAESIVTSTDRMGYGQGLFTLSIALTSKGVEQVDHVIGRVFEALQAYRKSGIPSHIFEEVEKMAKLSYAYQEREDSFDYVKELSYCMVDEQLSTFPTLTLMPIRYDGEKVLKLLEVMTPEKAFYTVVAPSSAVKVKWTQKEKWMEVPYTLAPIGQEKIALWSASKPATEIALPAPNPFIPQNLKILSEVKEEKNSLLPSPTLLTESQEGMLYYAPDDRFFVPHISWNLTYRTPAVVDSDPTSRVLSDLFVKALEKKMKPVIYAAELAGLSYSLESFSNGWKLALNGYSEKGGLFLKSLAEGMKGLKVNEEEFSLLKEELSRAYHNKLTKSPISEGSDLLSSLLYKDHAGLSVKAQALEEIDAAKFLSFANDAFKVGYLEATFFGNLLSDEALNHFEAVKKILAFHPYAEENHYKVATASLAKDGPPLYITKRSKQNGHALFLMIDQEGFTFEKKGALDVLTKGLEEPFFSELRTRQQTAYLLSNWSQEIERHLYSFFVIQSSSHDSRDLLSRFELFFEQTLGNFASHLSEERFESIKASTIDLLKHTAENSEGTGKVLHTLACDYDGDFEWLSKRIQALEGLSYSAFKRYAEEFLGKRNGKRLAICIQGTLDTAKPALSYKRLSSPQKVKKELSYEPQDKHLLETASKNS